MGRTFYAIVHGNSSSHPHHIHRFTTVAERTRFLDDQVQGGKDAEPIKATHSLVKKAIRYAKHADWPQAV